MGLMAARAPTDAASGAAKGGSPAKIMKKLKNLSLLKRMVDDDDDSSSDDDKSTTATTTTPTAAHAKGNGVKGSDTAALRETRPRRNSGPRTEEKHVGEKKKGASHKEKREDDRNKKEKKTTTKAMETEKKARSKKKEEEASTSVKLVDGLNVRSERLQLRAALIESTTKVAVVTPDEKAKKMKPEPKAPVAAVKEPKETPQRKRRRTSSSDATAAPEPAQPEDASVKPQEQEAQAKRPRLTRQTSREALKKQHDAEEKAVKGVEEENPKEAETTSKENVADAHAVRKQGRDKSVVNGDQEMKAVPAETQEDRVEDKSSHKSRMMKRREGAGKDEAIETEKARSNVTMANETISNKSKRRSKAISNENDVEVEPLAAESTVDNGNRRREKRTAEERSPAKAIDVEAGEKRKRLKRPLSAASSSGSKSMSLAALLDREKPGTLTTKSLESHSRARRENGKDRKVDDLDKKSARKEESQHAMGSEKRKLEKRRQSSSARADSREEDRRVRKQDRATDENDLAKSRLKRKDRSAQSGATTLDAYIKERENREPSTLRKEVKRVQVVEDIDADNEKLRENGSHASAKSTVVSGDEKQSAHEEDNPVDEPEGTYETEDKEQDVTTSISLDRSIEETVAKQSSRSGDVSANDASPSEVKTSLQAANSTKTAEEEEEGVVSDHESSAEEKKTIISGVDATSAAGTSDAQDQADPMSFVIPKKRPTAVTKAHSSPKTASQVAPAPRQTGPRESTTPGPSPSPVSSTEMITVVPSGRQKPRSKNAVPPKMTPLSVQEKEFFGLAKKLKSLLKAASVITVRGPSSVQPQLVSPFGCTSDRYGVMLESGEIYSESTTRMTCPTRKQIKSNDHTPAFFGVAMEAPQGVASDDPGAQSTEGEVKSAMKVSCYEKLEFAKADDRDWYLKLMYGTNFVPQLLRERVTLVMRNARYVRKSTGLHFNAQRDKEEFAAQLAERYTVNRSVPRCDILQKNWQLLVNGRVTFVFLHYMNHEDALIARAQFKDDDGQPLIIKGETNRANEPAVNNGGRVGVSPALSPPSLSSPPPRRRSRSRSNGRSPPRRADHPDQRGRDGGRDRPLPPQWQGDGGPRPPRDRSVEIGRGRRGGTRRSGNGVDAQNGGRYGPRPRSRSPPPRRASRSRSRSPHRSSQEGPTTCPDSPQSSQQDRGAQFSAHDSQESQDREKRSEPEMSSQGTLASSQVTAATQDSSMNGDENSSQGVGHYDDRRHSIGDRDGGGPRRARSRSRSRPRMPGDRLLPPPPHSDRRGSEDRSFQRDRRSSGEYYGRGRDDRRGQSPPPFAEHSERDRHGREFDRYGNLDQHHHPNHHQNHHQHYDDRAPPPRDYDHRGHFEADPYRRQHPRDDRRFH